MGKKASIKETPTIKYDNKKLKSKINQLKDLANNLENHPADSDDNKLLGMVTDSADSTSGDPMMHLVPLAKGMSTNLACIATVAEMISKQLVAQTHRANIQTVKDANVLDAEVETVKMPKMDGKKAQREKDKALGIKKGKGAAIVLDRDLQEYHATNFMSRC
ncbi:hypothetical protein HDU98_003432, partial [Podochytrium sp. JEL0797]